MKKMGKIFYFINDSFSKKNLKPNIKYTENMSLSRINQTSLNYFSMYYISKNQFFRKKYFNKRNFF